MDYIIQAIVVIYMTVYVVKALWVKIREKTRDRRCKEKYVDDWSWETGMEKQKANSSPSLYFEYETFMTVNRKIHGERLDWKQLANLYVPIPNEPNQTTEIDQILITNRAVYVIECKHFKGKLEGEARDSNLHSVDFYGNERWVKNPFAQNHFHINCLLGLHIIPNKKIPVYNILVIPKECKLYLQRTRGDNFLSGWANPEKLPQLIANLEKKRENNTYLSAEEIERIYHGLRYYSQAPEEVRRKHIAWVKSRVEAQKKQRAKIAV